MILGDFNFECHDNHSCYKMFERLCDEYKLTCCDSRAEAGIQYTYFHDSLGRYSFIDHMFVDKGTFANVINYKTIDSGLNLSDHVPLSCTLALPLGAELRGGSGSYNNQVNRKINNVLRWDRGDLALYYSLTGQLLQGLHVPYELLLTKCDGSACSHQDDINGFYKQIIGTLEYAAKCAESAISEVRHL